MAELNITDNEYAHLTPEDVAHIAIQNLDESAMLGERALALALVLRDRIEIHDEADRDPTACVLANMLIDELEFSPERSVKQCIAALLARCAPTVKELEGGAA